MGWSKLTKSMDANPLKKPNKVSFGTKGTAERTIPLKQEKQVIEGYDYKPVTEEKGSLRRDKLKEQGRNIFNNPELTEEQKSFQLQQLINQEKIHQDKFKPDKERKQHLRDKVLNKRSEEELLQRFDKRTDGNYYTKE